MAVVSKLDQEAADVLRAAREIAEARGEPRIASHALLVALTEAAPPPVRSALARFGLGPAEARTWLDSAITAVPTPFPFDAASPYAERTAAILEMAGAEAQEAGATEIRSRDLLFGILREKSAVRGVTSVALLARGATYDALHAALD